MTTTESFVPSILRATFTRILLVEDNPLHAQLVREMLFDQWGQDVEVRHCATLAEVDPTEAPTFDCILLDLSLPDAEGLDAVLDLRATASGVPIVVLSSRGDDTIALSALQQGAQDYLTKGTIDGALLSRSIRYAIERKGLESQLAYQALHDGLTGVPNRTLFLDRLQLSLLRADRRTGTVAVYFVDLDGFKAINDEYGHAVGDRILTTVAARLLEAVRPEDTVARFGGDEFLVLCADIAEPAAAVAIARRIIDVLGAPVRIGHKDVWITASIGVALALAGDPPVDADALVHDADAAMYRAKRMGKDRYEFHDHSVATLLDDLNGESGLRQAIERRELVLHYQPIFELATGRIVGAEALVRWDHPSLGTRPPADFVPLAERTGLIVPMGAWVFGEACRQVAAWRDGLGSTLNMSVNLAAAQLAHPQLVELVAGTLAATRTPPGDVWLEVTETGVMQDIDMSIAMLETLDALGVNITLDDFGTGYSSLAYLGRLPARVIKLDRAFVSWLGERGDSPILIGGVVQLAHDLGVSVVAEGVENTFQLDELRRLGCEFGQGYLLGHPLAADEFERTWLQT